MNDLWKIPSAESKDDAPQIQVVRNQTKSFAEEISTAIEHTAVLYCLEIEPIATDYV